MFFYVNNNVINVNILRRLFLCFEQSNINSFTYV